MGEKFTMDNNFIWKLTVSLIGSLVLGYIFSGWPGALVLIVGFVGTLLLLKITEPIGASSTGLAEMVQKAGSAAGSLFLVQLLLGWQVALILAGTFGVLYLLLRLFNNARYSHTPRP